MKDSILTKLNTIERLVKELRQELLCYEDTPHPAPHKLFFSFNGEQNDSEEFLEFDLNDMDLEELWAIANELELDLPKHIDKESLIAAIAG